MNRTNQGTNFIVLKNWDKRTSPLEHADAFFGNYTCNKSNCEQYHGFNRPAIQGLGTVGGFEFWIESRGNGDYAYLEEVTNKFLAKTRERPIAYDF